MSEDIKSFLATGGYRPNRSPRRAPLVLPSGSPKAVSGALVKTLQASYPFSRLVPKSDRDAVDQGFVAPHDEEKRHQNYQRESLALDAPPYSYTGKAELRGEIAPTPSQEDVSYSYKQTTTSNQYSLFTCLLLVLFHVNIIIYCDIS